MSVLPLEVRALSKAYRRRVVLREVSLAASPGEALAILGPNGSGKSTFLGCITGDRLPDRGEVRLCGADPFSDLRSAAGCMGFVPEHPFLYGELSVRETIQFVIAARGLPRDASDEAARLLALLGLEGAEGALARELSQGMGRKLALTLALLHRPRLLVLDEALNGLDQPSALRVLEELERRRAEGAAVLLSTHDLELAARWCGRGLLLAQGGDWTLLEGGSWQRWGRAPSLRPDALRAEPPADRGRH